MFRRLPAGDAPPHFSLKKKNGPCTVQKEMSRRYGGSRSGRCGHNLQPCTGCAIPLQNRDGASPHFWAWCCFRGGYRTACPSGPAAAARMRQGSGSEKQRWSIRLPPRKQVGTLTCGGVLSRFRPCPAHPAEGHQLTRAPVTATPVLRK